MPIFGLVPLRSPHGLVTKHAPELGDSRAHLIGAEKEKKIAEMPDKKELKILSGRCSAQEMTATQIYP